MTVTSDMTDTDLLKYLIESAAVPQESVISYTAGYFEGTLLSLMARFPEVRKEIEDRVNYRRKDIVKW